MLAIFVALSCVFLPEHFFFAQAFAVLQRILHRHSVGDFVLTPQREMLFEDRSILSVTYDILSELYGLEGQELIDAVTAEHELMEMFKKRGMDYNQIYELTKYQNHRPMNTSEG